MEREIVMCPYNGILLSHKRRSSTDPCNNVVEPENSYVEDCNFVEEKWKQRKEIL